MSSTGPKLDDYLKLPQIKQHSLLWYQSRSKLITASKASSALHLNSFHSYQDYLSAPNSSSPDPGLATEITLSMAEQHVAGDRQAIDPCTWGIVLEPIARQNLAQKLGSQIHEIGLRIHPTYPYLGASPDGITVINGCSPEGLAEPNSATTELPMLVEIKCLKSRDLTGQIPIEYWVQTQLQMEVWDIESTIYAEFVFQLVVGEVSDALKKQCLAWDELTAGVCWVLNERVHQVITRDRVWFRQVLPELSEFYIHKYFPENQMVADMMTVDGHEQDTVTSFLPERQLHKMTLRSRKRKRNLTPTKSLLRLPKKTGEIVHHYGPNCQQIHQQLKNQFPDWQQLVPNISQQASKHPDLMAIGRLTNFFRDDPLLDWLEIHGQAQGYSQDKNYFLTHWQQLNLRYRLQVIRYCQTTCQTLGHQYRHLNKGLKSLLQLPSDQLLLKVQHDYHLLLETKQAMIEEVPIIFMGQLGISVPVDLSTSAPSEVGGEINPPSNPREYVVWDTYDLLVRSDVFIDIFPGEANQVLLVEHQKLMFNKKKCLLQGGGESWYLPIKIKYTSLEFLKNKCHLSAKHNFEKQRLGAITNALLLGSLSSKEQLANVDRGLFPMGLIPYQNQLHKNLQKGIQWLQQVQTKLDWHTGDLWPNMKNQNDSPWHSAKKQIAHQMQELTQVAYLSVGQREKLHHRGVKTIADLQRHPNKANLVSERVLGYLNDELLLPDCPINRHQLSAEVFLDFETSSQLGDQPALIFLIGIKYRRLDDGQFENNRLRNNEQDEFVSLMATDLSVASQNQILDECLELLTGLGPRVMIYHWTQAEPNFLTKVGYQLPNNCEWFDLHHLFVKEQASIPGCYTYSLKDVAESLANLDLIESRWQHGLDGNAAMILSEWADRKCQLTGDSWLNQPDMMKIREYNYIDVQVMVELFDLLLHD